MLERTVTLQDLTTNLNESPNLSGSIKKSERDITAIKKKEETLIRQALLTGLTSDQVIMFRSHHDN